MPDPRLLDTELREEPLTSLAAHAEISIAFQGDRVLIPSTEPGGLEALTLVEVLQEPPYMNDYDAIPGNDPLDWPRRFDTSGWALISAWLGGERVGGVVIAYSTEGVDMLEGRLDLAVLWDFRVAPEVRGTGVGAALFEASEEWARSRGCIELKVETQNINVPACTFYERQGCELRAIDRFAYPDVPDEIQLLWYKRLT